MADDSVDIVVRLQGERVVAAKAKKIARDIDDLGEAGERTQKRWTGMNNALGITRKAMGMIKLTGVITALGFVAQAASAASAGVVALTAALSPLMGSLIALPALGFAAAQGLGAFLLATNGVMDAVGGLNEEMDLAKLGELTPAAQSFAIALDGMKRPIRDVQDLIGEQMFPKMLEGIKAAGDGLVGFRKELPNTGRVLGDLSLRLGKLVGSEGFGSDLQTGLRVSNRWLSQMGETLINFTSALRHVMIAAIPLVSWMGNVVVGWSRAAKVGAETARETGRLAMFFDLVRRSMQLVGGIIGPFAVGMKNIFAAALPTGMTMLEVLRDSAVEFRNWTASIEGRASIAKWFEDALPAMVEAGRLARDLVKAFFEIGSGEHVAPLLAAIRTELLPAFVQLIAATTSGFGPAFISFLVSASSLISALSSGPLVMFLQGMTAVVGSVAALLTHVPGLSQLVGVVFTMALASRVAVGAWNVLNAAMATGRAIANGAVMAYRLLQWNLAAFRVSAVGATIATTAMSAATRVAAVAAGIGSVAFRAMGVAATLMFGPWGILVAGLIAGAILIVTHWDEIKGAASAAVDWITDKFGGMVEWFKSLPGRMADALSGLWDGLKNGLKSAVNWILDKLRSFHIGWDKQTIANAPDIPAFHFRPFEDLPQLAMGGVVSGRGSWISGEAGAELNTFDGNRVRVEPLSRVSRSEAPSSSLRSLLEPAMAAASAGGKRIIQVAIDGRVIAEAVEDQIADIAARA